MKITSKITREESVTTEQFTAMAILSVKGDLSDDTPAYLDFALSNGVIEDYDIINKAIPIERRAAARIAHMMLAGLCGEEDERDWRGADKFTDLYACHTCVNHIAQMYAKGIMSGRTNDYFDNHGTLTRTEAETIAARMANPELRVIPEKKSTSVTAILPEQLMRINNAVIADVRDALDYAAGHIDGSINAPLTDLQKNPYVINPDLNRPIVLYCSRGYKSILAAQLLTEAGYNNIYTLPGVEQYDYELID